MIEVVYAVDEETAGETTSLIKPPAKDASGKPKKIGDKKKTGTVLDRSTCWVFRNPVITHTQVLERSPATHKVILERHIFTVRGVVLADNTITPLDQVITEARCILKEPRGTFLIRDEAGNSIFTHTRKDDLAAGPWPMLCNAEEIYNSNLVRILWQVQLVRRHIEQDETWGEPHFGYDFAYTIATSFDENFYETRTLNGIVRFTPERLVGGDMIRDRGADWARIYVTKHLCVCPPDWDRISMNFQESEDRLALSFSIVDRQRLYQLPKGVSSGDVSLRVSGGLQLGKGGAEGFASASVVGYFEGPPTRTKEGREAPLKAVADIIASLFTDKGDMVGGAIVQSLAQMTITRHLFRNRYDFSYVWNVLPNIDIDEFKAAKKLQTSLTALLDGANKWLKSLAKLTSKDRGLPLDAGGTSSIGGTCGEGLLESGEIPMEHGLDTAEAKAAAAKAGAAGVAPNFAAVTKKVPSGPITYLEWNQSFKYQFDEGYVIVPMMNGTHHVQRARGLSALLHVDGAARRYGNYPQAPSPPYVDETGEATTGQITGGSRGAAQIHKASTKDEAWLLDSEVVTESPRLDKTCRVAWKYTIKLTGKTAEKALLEQRIPNDPQISAAGYLGNAPRELAIRADGPIAQLPTEEYA